MRFTDNGTVMIYRGRDLLWFSATQEAPGQYSRDQLDGLSIGRVENSGGFATLDDAARFVQTLTPTTTTTVVTTTTTVPRATTTLPRTTTTSTSTSTTGG